jgi:hypothetical protein
MSVVDDFTFLEVLVPLVEAKYYKVTLWGQEVEPSRLGKLILNTRTKNSLCFTVLESGQQLEETYKAISKRIWDL